MRAHVFFSLVALMLFGSMTVMSDETFPPMEDGVIPQTFEDLWSGFDPGREPLDVEVLKEGDEDGVVFKVLRYRIGVFKGQKAMMAAVYGYAKGATNLPGLVQIHGGGQYAHWNAVRSNAKRGYATISIAWAGRLDAPGYRVGPDEVKLFWDGATNDPRYKLTTDWGALDAYHAPCRNPATAFGSLKPAEWTLDDVESPRNSPWFLYAVAARRALTFLEQQPEVNKDKLGVYGHSMGGQQAVALAGTDSRIKAAAPSCGGVSYRNSGDALIDACMADPVHLRHIACPVFFLSPANDFNGTIRDLQTALGEIKSSDWRITCAPHHNHQDTAEYAVATQLWFDQQLKGTIKVPVTPETALELSTENGVPRLTVKPDASPSILYVNVFYTQHGPMSGGKEDRENTMNRFWHYAATTRHGDAWMADLPLPSVDKPLWVYANVIYPLDPPVSGAGYYYGIYTASTFNLSSRMTMVSPNELRAAGVRATLMPARVIESFAGDWDREWFTYRPQEWGRFTRKLHSDVWRAPEGAALAFEVRAAESNKMVVGLDHDASEIEVRGGSEWQSVRLATSDFHDAAGHPRTDWKGIRELRIVEKDRLKTKIDGVDKEVVLGGGWKGAPPEFRNLQWIPVDSAGAEARK